MAVTIKNAALYMTPCSLLKIYQHFRGTCCLNMQGRGFIEDERSSFLQIVGRLLPDCVMTSHRTVFFVRSTVYSLQGEECY